MQIHLISAVIGSVVGITLSILPVFLCFKLLKGKLFSAYNPYIRGILIGILLWIVTFVTFFYLGYKYGIFIFSINGGGEAGLAAIGVLILISFYTIIGFILSGLIVAHFKETSNLTASESRMALKNAIILLMCWSFIFFFLAPFVWFILKNIFNLSVTYYYIINLILAVVGAIWQNRILVNKSSRYVNIYLIILSLLILLFALPKLLLG